MPEYFIDSIDDPRARFYRDMKERDLARQGHRFIVESRTIVLRLLASRVRCESILVSDDKLHTLQGHVPPEIDLLVAPKQIVTQILGFKFHSGVMAVAIRPPRLSLDDLKLSEQSTFLICPEVEKNDNMGTLIRICAAFGVDALILGQRCCDPFFRQSVRISMGTAFALPIVQSIDIAHDMNRLRQQFNTTLFATILDPAAMPVEQCPRSHRVGIVLGNESQGLASDLINLCDQPVTLPMHLGTDSLNVSIAAGIFLYHFTRVARI